MTPDTHEELRAGVLARMLLIQSTAGHLPDEPAIIAFVCRGLQMLPGVRQVSHNDPKSAPSPDEETRELYPLQFGSTQHGAIVITLSDSAAYAPYAPHVQNLLYVVGVMLEERHQRRLAATYQTELEQRVDERTRQLTEEITERRSAELRALAAMNRAESYLEIAEALIVELDSLGNVSVVNKRACDVLGYTQEELIGKNWFDTVVPPSDAPLLHAVFRSVASGELQGTEYFDNEVVTKSGERRYIAWHNRLRTEGGPPWGTLSSGLDLTERKRFEFALASEKERLSVTLRSIGDGVISTDTGGQIVAMNPVAEQLTGTEERDALGRFLTDVFVVVDERTQQPCENPVTRVLETASAVGLSNHIQLRSRDGTKRSISNCATPIRDRDGKIIGVVLVFRDVTERYRLIEQMQRAERLDAIGVLAGGIAHDFNNLLGGIFGYINLAREHATEGDPQAVALDEALQVFERARDLTRQLLTFSKGGAPVRSVVDLRKLLIDCARFALSGSNVSPILRFPAELPSVAVDANQIWRVIDNLVRNAVQAMPQGGTLWITGDTTHLSKDGHPVLPEGRYVKVTISDDGPGIPSDILPKIFDPFFTTKERGSGLGLATAYSVVRKHEGTIEVESRLGQGTSFRIYLPELKAAEQVVTQTAASPLHRGQGPALVLDDEPYLCKLFERYLRRMGYEVTAVPDGQRAILAVDAAIAAGRPFVVALMDLTVPGGMGGKDAIAHIRPKCPELVAIASSGYSDDPVMADPAQFGFTASLGKPFAMPELAAVLARHVTALHA